MSASKYNDLDAVEALIEKAADANASDLHLVAGKAPAIRRFGELVYLDGEPVLTDIDCKALLAVFGINGGTALSNMFVSEGRLDFSQAFGLSKGRTQRVRVNVSLQLRTPSWCFRFISEKIPSLEQLGIPKAVVEMGDHRWGLVLVTGPRGSGKSTTIASLIDRINRTKSQRIVIIEDAVEFVYSPNEKSIITQREVPADAVSYERALADVLRQDVDVVQIGEIRSREMLQTALSLAEAGCLVFATFHSPRVIEALDRLVNMFPADVKEQVLVQLYHVLRGVVAQKLNQTIGKGRDEVAGLALSCEILTSKDHEVRSMIRKGEFGKLTPILEERRNGCISMGEAISDLFKNTILRETREKDYDSQWYDRNADA